MAETVQLAHDDAGSGEPALLLLHPWSGNRSFFEPQMARFSGEYRCIAIDLRGHGESPAPESGYTIGELADDVGALCRQLGVGSAVPVGHSMGGIVAVHLAARHPDLVSGVVVLDSPLLPPAAFSEAVGPLLEGIRSPQFREVTRGFQSQFVGFPNDEARREAILDQLVAGPQHVKASTLEAVFDDVANEAALAATKVPLLYVGSGMGFADLDRVRAAAGGGVESVDVSGAGHFIQLEVPDQVNDRIAAFLTRL